MKEENSAGGKEFVFSLLWALLLLFLGRGLINSLPSYKIIGTLITLLAFCALGFFVLTRYSSRFTYENTGYSLRLNRTIGKRNREVEIGFNEITEISASRPKRLPKTMFYMKTKVFSDKGSYYVLYSHNGADGGAAFEPSEEFMKKLEKSMKAKKGAEENAAQTRG